MPKSNLWNMQRSECLSPLCMLFIVSFFTAALAGCSDGPRLVPVSGQVTIDGAPLSFGFVRLVPAGGGRPATGKLDSSGNFALSTYKVNDGAVEGSHEVEIIMDESISDTKVRWHAPKKYGNRKTSGLIAEITGPTQDMRFELTWDGGEPFIEVTN